MALRVVGAGLPRTGTASLKLALERLLGGPCYHMFEVFAEPGHIPVWHDAARGQPPAWDRFLASYHAAIDLPASAFWQDLAEANPGALIVLSVRDSPQQWWDSCTSTFFSPAVPSPDPGTTMAGYLAMAMDVWQAWAGPASISDADAMMAAYQRHNDTVRASAPPGRLLEWRAADGWAPLAAALGVPVPSEPFPHVNSRSQFRVPEFGTKPGWATALSPEQDSGPPGTART